MYFATRHCFRHRPISHKRSECGSIMAISVAVLPANHAQADMATDHMMCKLCCQQLYQLCNGANQNTASLKY